MLLVKPGELGIIILVSFLNWRRIGAFRPGLRLGRGSWRFSLLLILNLFIEVLGFSVLLLHLIVSFIFIIIISFFISGDLLVKVESSSTRIFPRHGEAR